MIKLIVGRIFGFHRDGFGMEGKFPAADRNQSRRGTVFCGLTDQSLRSVPAQARAWHPDEDEFDYAYDPKESSPFIGLLTCQYDWNAV